MRIAMIIQNFFPVIGGAEKQALALSTALVARGHKVDVYTMSYPGSPARESLGGVSVFRLRPGAPDFLRPFVFAIASAFRWATTAFRYEAVHVHLASSHAIFPAVWGRLTRRNVFIKLGGGFGIGELALSRRSWVGRTKLALLSWARPCFILVNVGQREELIKSGLAGARTAFIPNGVDLSRFRPASPEEKKRLRSRLAMDGLVFLFVGRFAADKLRLDIFERFLSAWAGVRKSFGDISLVMVGQGPLEGDYRRLINDKGVGASVRIVGPTDRVADFAQAADVFVLPSITEGLSNALLEALACGLPVCGSRVPGIVDIVEEGKQGVLFDPMSAADIERALLHIIKRRERLAPMGRICLETARAYSLDATVLKTLALYEGRGV